MLQFTIYKVQFNYADDSAAKLYFVMVNCKCPYFLSELQIRVFISFTRFSSSFITLRS